MFIARYQKITDQYSIRRMELFDADGGSQVNSLANIGNWEYVSCTDSVDISSFDPAFFAETVDMTPDLREKIKKNSPQCQRIKAIAHQNIADEFDAKDQRMLDRKIAAAGAGLITLSEDDRVVLQKYQTVNQSALSWAGEQYAEMGL